MAVAGVPVGVDIEKVNANLVTAEMIKEVFSEEEWNLFSSNHAPGVTDTFFRGWVRKESVVKAIGSGVYFPLRLVESKLDRDSFTAVYEGTEWWTCSLEARGTGYRAALTALHRGAVPRLRFKHLSA